MQSNYLAEFRRPRLPGAAGERSRGTAGFVGRTFLRQMLFALPALLVLMTWGGEASAQGTPAGTTITNIASATYEVGPDTFSATSPPNSFKVAQLVNLTVSWQDGSNVPVVPGDTNKVLTFRVTNTGNGSDTFNLVINDLLAGDNFDPVAAAQPIWIDTNGSGTYNAGDTVVTSVTLAADAGATIFLLNGIPSPQADGNTGNSQLAAATNYGAGAPGTIKTGAGPGGIDVVLGTSGGAANAAGIYQIASVAVSIAKSSTITDPYGTSQPIPGAVITYTLSVSASGSTTAKNVIVTDPIPANTTYKPGSLNLNAAPLTDGSDPDAGDVGGTTSGTVTVKVGDLTSAMGTQTVTFKVTIN